MTTSVGDFHDHVDWSWKICPLWTPPFPRQGVPGCGRVRRVNWTQAGTLGSLFWSTNMNMTWQLFKLLVLSWFPSPELGTLCSQLTLCSVCSFCQGMLITATGKETDSWVSGATAGPQETTHWGVVTWNTSGLRPRNRWGKCNPGTYEEKPFPCPVLQRRNGHRIQFQHTSLFLES